MMYDIALSVPPEVEKIKNYQNYLNKYTIIPNEFFVEILGNPKLSLSTVRVMTYIVRELYGFNRRYVKISHADFIHGKFSIRGEQLSTGAGVCENVLKKALKELAVEGYIKTDPDLVKGRSAKGRGHITSFSTSLPAPPITTNFVRIPHLFFPTVLGNKKLPDSTISVLLFIMRMTIGFDQIENFILPSQFSEDQKKENGEVFIAALQNLSNTTLERSLSALEDRYIIRRPHPGVKKTSYYQLRPWLWVPDLKGPSNAGWQFGSYSHSRLSISR